MPHAARSRFGLPVSLLLTGAMLLAAACGGETAPAAEAGEEEAGAAQATATAEPAEPADGIDGVYAALEGLAGEERQARLLELAQAEGGVLSFYDSMNGEEGPAILEAFEEATGLSVERYRASSQDVMTRVVEEAEANATASDVVAVNGVEAVILDREGLFAPLQIDVEGYPQDQVEDTWAWSYINAYAPWWNTDYVPESEAPETWEDVLSYDGRLALEVKAFDWFGTVVEDYLMAQQGLTEEAAVDLFRAAADNALLVDGYSVAGQHLAAGEFDMTVGYSWIASGLEADGAPIAWRPPVEPMVARPSGVGVHSETDQPATALAYIEFLLGDGQEILAEYGRTPAVPTVEGGLPQDVEVLWVDLEQMLDEREKWESLYREVLQSSEAEVIEG